MSLLTVQVDSIAQQALTFPFLVTMEPIALVLVYSECRDYARQAITALSKLSPLHLLVAFLIVLIKILV